MANNIKNKRHNKVSFNVEEHTGSESAEDSQNFDSDSASDQSGDEKEDVEDEASEALNDSFGESEESEQDSDDDLNGLEMPQKKHKGSSESFSKAMTAILGSKVKAHQKDDPILIRSKKSAKDLETSKLEAKARRALAVEKKQLLDKDRIRQLIPTDGSGSKEVLYEQELKKVAKRGVVQLFNAILASQNATKGADKSPMVKTSLQEEQLAELSKEKFLDMIKSGTS